MECKRRPSWMTDLALARDAKHRLVRMESVRPSILTPRLGANIKANSLPQVLQNLSLLVSSQTTLLIGFFDPFNFTALSTQAGNCIASSPKNAIAPFLELNDSPCLFPWRATQSIGPLGSILMHLSMCNQEQSTAVRAMRRPRFASFFFIG